MKLTQVWTDSELSYTGLADVAGRDVMLEATCVTPGAFGVWRVRATCERGVRRLRGHRRYRAEVDDVPTRDAAVALFDALAASVVALANAAEGVNRP